MKDFSSLFDRLGQNNLKNNNESPNDMGLDDVLSAFSRKDNSTPNNENNANANEGWYSSHAAKRNDPMRQIFDDPKTALELLKVMGSFVEKENDKLEKDRERRHEEDNKSEAESWQKFLEYVKIASHTSLLNNYSKPYEERLLLDIFADIGDKDLDTLKQEDKMRRYKRKKVMEEEIIKRGFFDKRLADMSDSELFERYSSQPIRYDMQYTLMGKSEKEIDDTREQNERINEIMKKSLSKSLKKEDCCR